MKVQCPSCKTSYNINKMLIPVEGARAKCKKCGNAFHVCGDGQVDDSQADRLPEERLAEQYIHAGDKDALVRVLYEGILKYSRGKLFDDAEKLRDLLIDAVPMALTEIIETGELIETEKSQAMDPEKIRPWADLYTTLTPSEAAAFYFALSDMKIMPKEMVFEQGKFGDRLYFIQSGRFEVSYFDQELQRNISYRVLQKGDIIGTDTFFNFTNHSDTLTAEIESTILRLDKKRYEKLLRENPAIESKLCNYCEDNKKGCRIETEKRLVRRIHKRYRVSHSGKVQQIDATGNATGPITKMILSDISAGGLCYLLQNLKYNDAYHLLGSMLKIVFTYPKNDGVREDVTVTAKVVSMRFHPFGECSVHVQFDKPLVHAKAIEIAGRKI